MNEADRKQRNYIKVNELHPNVRPRMEAVLRKLESYGYRPRIQEAWRSPKDQLAAYNAGTSKIKYGFHNVTTSDGTKEALAADVWDDDRPFNAKTHFMLHLLAAAEKNGLTTGIRWSLSDNRIKLIEDAIAQEDWKRPVWVGWDPLHVEVTEVTVKEAESGKRPEMPGSDNGTDDNQPPPDDTNVPTPDDKTDEPQKHEPEPIQYRVENLETGHTKNYELTTVLRPVTLLGVPYISQLGPGADSRHNDCGAATAAMVLAAYTGAFITPDEFYDKFNISGDPYLTVDHVRNALGSGGVATEFKSNLEIKDLFGYLHAGIPVIVPTKYSILYEAGLTESNFAGPHFSVAIGMDLKNVYAHDPLFTDPEEGNAHAYPLDIFLKAWADTTLISSYAIPQRSAIIPTSPIGVKTVKRVRITVSRLNVRQGPGTNYPVAGSATLKQEYDLISEANGWGEISTGHWISLSYTETIPSTVPAPLPQPDNGNQKEGEPQEPGHGILFNINLASSVPKNPTGSRAAEYIFNDPLIPSTQRNLCGDIALSMIYETVTSQQNTLGYIHQGSKNTTRKPTGGTNAYEFAQQFANTFPSDWKAHTYYLSYLYYFEAGNSRHVKDSPGALGKSLTQKSPTEIKNMIIKMLVDNTFVIAGASQSTLMEGAGATRLNPKGVGHWVVVAGISDQYIYINNPFMNRRETYTWAEFLESFGYWILQIFPPGSFQPQVYSGPMENVHAKLEQDRNKA
jgi:predicted double-glycine peptidase